MLSLIPQSVVRAATHVIAAFMAWNLASARLFGEGNGGPIHATLWWTAYYSASLLALLLVIHGAARVPLWASGWAYMFLSKDKKGLTKTPDPGAADAGWGADDEGVRSIHLLFLRHGESTWNETFNRGYNPIFFIPRLVYAFAYETWLLASGVRDSWFYDSPLSHEGIGQCEALRARLARYDSGGSGADEDPSVELAVLRGDPGAPRSTVVTSNLRRAISTVLIGLWDRLSAAGGGGGGDAGGRGAEKVTVLQQLQEISRNPDTLSITPRRTPAEPSWIEKDLPQYDMKKAYAGMLNVRENMGNKDRKTTGLMRLRAFADWCFAGDRGEYVVVGGHSLYFRTFFRVFLPRSVEGDMKAKKIANGGVVALTLRRREKEGKAEYRIDPASVKPVYLGWK